MSVLVKGMKIPENCCGCHLESHNMCLINKADAEDWFEERPETCPLVELPAQHGRLIDADHLLARILTGVNESTSFTEHVFYRAACSLVSDEPTVIEAEGGSEGGGDHAEEV